MKSFIDTGDLTGTVDMAATGLLDGLATNPIPIAKTGPSIPGSEVRPLHKTGT